MEWVTNNWIEFLDHIEQNRVANDHFISSCQFFQKFFGNDCNVLEIISGAIEKKELDAGLASSFKFVVKKRVHQCGQNEAGFYAYANDNAVYFGSTVNTLTHRSGNYRGNVLSLYNDPKTFVTIWGVCDNMIEASTRSVLETIVARRISNPKALTILNKI